MGALDLDPQRPLVDPIDAATLLLVRDTRDGVQILCVERSRKSGFLGGAIVFPGGKVDPLDASPEWDAVCEATPVARGGFARDELNLRALAVAACRETFEEAAILPLTSLDDSGIAELRAERSRLSSILRERGVRLDLSKLHAIARWVTPVSEPRRYDTRFFVARAPEGQAGLHDGRETTSIFWATGSEVLRRFDAREIEVFPPTHRMLSLLAGARDTDEVIAMADRACLDPICPMLVDHADTIALVLPGDPQHEVRDPRIPGSSRFVLQDGRFLPGNPT
jgi:8-oxo-dGTP pyrophosphatase MutT (NUDIX family)